MKKDLWSWKSFSILKDFCSFVHWDTASFRRIKTELWNKNLHSLCSFTKFSVLWNLENKEIFLNTGSSSKFPGVRYYRTVPNFSRIYLLILLLFTNQNAMLSWNFFHLFKKSNTLKDYIECFPTMFFQTASFFACNHLYSKITMMLKHTPRCVFSIMFSHCYAK